MSASIKFLLILVVFYSELAFACRLPPVEVMSSAELGFTHSISEAPPNSCANCSSISIKIPKTYKSNTFHHGFFDVYLKDELVSRTKHSLSSIFESFQFIGFVNSGNDFRYEVSFEYGNSRCTNYKFLFRGKNSDS